MCAKGTVTLQLEIFFNIKICNSHFPVLSQNITHIASSGDLIDIHTHAVLEDSFDTGLGLSNYFQHELHFESPNQTTRRQARAAVVTACLPKVMATKA